MSSEQQIASIVIGWVLMAMVGGVVWLVHWTDKRHAQSQAKERD